MSKRVMSGFVGGALLTSFALLAQQAAPAPGQNDSKGKTGTVGLYRNQPLAPTGPAGKLADGTPDLSGVWLGGGGCEATGQSILRRACERTIGTPGCGCALRRHKPLCR